MIYSQSDLYTNAISNCGTLTFHALRLHVRDEVFFRILRPYVERFRYGNASTPDFIAVAEEVSELDLDESFGGQLYNAQIPDIPEIGLD